MTKAIETERAFDFLRNNPRGAKPRHAGLTKIRGPYHSAMGPRYLTDVLETMGPYVDSLKFAGGSFTLMPRRLLTEVIELCHRHEVAVSTGGFIERVLTQGPDAVDRYIRTCRDLGFDIIEISSGFITLPADPDVFAWYVKQYGPEVNLFVDHSQIVQLDCLRAGIWGTADLWGKVVTYKG
jgi:phosphosulfolactate synthase (CoM biosynthesis protein A)